MDQSKKTMRHFYCRDVLWETFEQMANDFDCSIDYLINEAMRYYARSKNYQSPATSGVGPAVEPAPPPAHHAGGNSMGRPAPAPTPVTTPPRRPAPTTQPPQMPVGGGGAASPPRRPAPPTPAMQPAAAAAQYGGGVGSPRPQPPTPGGPGGYHQPAMPAGGYGQAAAAVAPAVGAGTLYLIYNGQRYPVNKDQFIIGRGSKTSDLAIKDGNISRKHAAEIRRNGTYYIKDLGSTNGIDYKGMRIDNKRIDEGDVFHLCDYEIRFTYRPE